MNIKQLNNYLKYRDTLMFQIFHNFIRAASYVKKYSLFNFYLFRTDVLEDSIKGKNYFFYNDDPTRFINGEINWRNKSIKKYVKENASLYVGNVYLTSLNGFRPLFISLKRYETGELMINGYSINSMKPLDEFFFNDITTKRIGKIKEKDMTSGNIRFSSDELRTHILGMSSVTGDYLDE
jgi:hypothetical protein